MSYKVLVSFGIGLLIASSILAQPIKLPPPRSTSVVSNMMTLKEAILIALRNNPQVHAAELQRVMDKYSVLLAYNNNFPQVSVGTYTATYQEGDKVRSSLTPVANIAFQSMSGVNYNVSYNQDWDHLKTPGQTTVTASRSLTRGWGAANPQAIALDNALDSELLARLNYKSSITGTVEGVINAYRSLMSSLNTLVTNRNSLKSVKLQLSQDQLRYKLGQVAKSVLIGDKQQIASTRLTVIQGENSIFSNRQALLTQLGLASSVRIHIDQKLVMPVFHIPTLKKAIKLAMLGNTAYLNTVIGMRQAKRALITAKDNLIWDLQGNVSKTYGSIGGGDSNSHPAVFSLSLNVPINDINAKRNYIQARINWHNRKDAMAQAKRTLISTITTKLQGLRMQKAQLVIAQEGLQLEKQKLHHMLIKIKYGKGSQFELDTEQETYRRMGVALGDTKSAYLGLILAYRTYIGTTLKHWGITLVY